ncbi:MAG: tRNA-dihydrouridine synthase family protein [Myxococcota bacterium]
MNAEQSPFQAPARTQPLRLNALPYARPTFLAPMEGVTHPLYRAIVASLGEPGCVCTEFVRITAQPIRPETLAKEVVRVPGLPLSVQVMGRELVRMREAAEVLDAAGTDAVDINMGCPTKNAAKGGVGAAMLKDPELLYEVVATMRAAVECYLSAKIRAGFDDKSRVVELARVVEAAGADYIAVHPRTRRDQYTGVADWRIVAVLAAELQIPVIGNGDAWYAADAIRMMEETGCHGVMIGRPAMRNPWIFRQIEELRAGEEPYAPDGEALVAFIDRIATEYREHFGKNALGRMKELIRWIGRAVDPTRGFLKTALRQQSVEELVGFCRSELSGRAADTIDLDAYGALGYETSGRCA